MHDRHFFNARYTLDYVPFFLLLSFMIVSFNSFCVALSIVFIVAVVAFAIAVVVVVIDVRRVCGFSLYFVRISDKRK